MDFHIYIDKTVSRPSYLYDGNSYAGKTACFYWDALQTTNDNKVGIMATLRFQSAPRPITNERGGGWWLTLGGSVRIPIKKSWNVIFDFVYELHPKQSVFDVA